MKGIKVYDVLVKSLVFGGRNCDKITNSKVHDEGRILATVGQFKKAINTVRTLDKECAKGASAAINHVAEAAKASKYASTFEKVNKAANFAAKNVNPLLCVAAGYRVATAKDKKKAVVREAVGMSTMFAVEKQMNNYIKMAKTTGWVSKIPNKNLKMLAEAGLGIAFVVGSVLSSTAGYKVADAAYSAFESKKTNKAEAAKADDKYVSEFYLPGQGKEIMA